MINYIIQVILFQVLFLALYDFILSKETFFTKNRWYLLSTPILSFLLPFIKIPTFQKAVPQEYIIYLPEIVLSPQKVIQETSWYQNINYIDVLFGIGVLIFSILFVAKLLQIINLIRSHKLIKKDGFTLVLIPNQTKAFSFFNYIFLGKEISGTQRAQIIEHELVHSKQKHSLDLLFFEFLKIVMWFNPIIFLYQKRITLLHEYISDQVATKKNPKENYINHLLSNFFQVENIAFINQFYKQTFIKKRIIMMTKKQSKKMNQLKYLLLIPALVSMLFYISCSENEANNIKVSKKEIEKRYRNKQGVLTSEEGKNKTYLDSYIGIENPINKEEISYADLSDEERAEFDVIKRKFNERALKRPERAKYINLKLFKGEKDRNMTALIFDLSQMKNLVKERFEEKVETEEVSFMTIEKTPTFPGCDSGDKDCFSKMVQKHFLKNFDSKLLSKLNLSSGRKRISIMFKIDKKGNVVDVKARAPHPKIKEEVLRVMESLPQMVPGAQDGKPVAVKYSIPFAIEVE
ncbi:M56 family metallopeptidase [Polaribacter cellanae]|uniref:Energy transducer TonB n=1 Tax=Polaribacter cellanae TaxID=2818493 RepID=A0A975CMP9_9FLAO|nr:M56 family metallopeptidase [Polaribacter cellanae]QTE22159.1 energy transducer TonB [Polaribacter cellanae]